MCGTHLIALAMLTASTNLVGTGTSYAKDKTWCWNMTPFIGLASLNQIAHPSANSN